MSGLASARTQGGTPICPSVGPALRCVLSQTNPHWLARPDPPVHRPCRYQPLVPPCRTLHFGQVRGPLAARVRGSAQSRPLF